MNRATVPIKNIKSLGSIYALKPQDFMCEILTIHSILFVDDEQSIRPFYKGVGIAVIVALLAFLLVQSVAYPHSMDEHRDGKNVYYVLLKMFSSVLYIKPFVR